MEDGQVGEGSLVLPVLRQDPSDPVESDADVLESLLGVPALLPGGREGAASLLRVLQVRDVEQLRFVQLEVRPAGLQEATDVVQVRDRGLELVHSLDGARQQLSHQPTTAQSLYNSTVT